MKRWILIIIASILVGFAIYIYIPFIEFNSGQRLGALLVLFLSFSFLWVAIYINLNYQSRQKVKTLQNRLSMWTKLSYHVNQVGDEVFNELPIGIIALDDDLEIKWANPHAKTIFDPRITGKDLKEVHPQLHLAAVNNKTQTMIRIKNETYDVTYRP
jgi:c-di-AMP phosphodiesterase-like protein